MTVVQFTQLGVDSDNYYLVMDKCQVPFGDIVYDLRMKVFVFRPRENVSLDYETMKIVCSFILKLVYK